MQARDKTAADYNIVAIAAVCDEDKLTANKSPGFLKSEPSATCTFDARALVPKTHKYVPVAPSSHP